MKGILIPQTVFIGDEAEFLYPLSQLKNFNYQKFKSGDFSVNMIEQNADMTITSFSIKQKSDELFISIKFIPWEVGEIEFPSFNAFGIMSDLPSIEISSMTSTMNIETIQPARPPLLVPGTTFAVYTGITVLFFIGILLFIVFKTIKYKIENIPHSILRKKRVKKINKELKKLKKPKGELRDSVIWLKQFEIVFRNYLIALIGVKKNMDPFYSKTYSELLNQIKDIFFSSDDVMIKLEDIFNLLKYDRFGTRHKSCNELINDYINRTFEVIELAETSIGEYIENTNKNVEHTV